MMKKGVDHMVVLSQLYALFFGVSVSVVVCLKGVCAIFFPLNERRFAPLLVLFDELLLTWSIKPYARLRLDQRVVAFRLLR